MTPTDDFASIFITLVGDGWRWDLLLIGVTWVMLHFMQERFYEWFDKPKLLWRILPFLPQLVTLPAATFVPGPWVPPDTPSPVRALLGVSLGVAAYFFGGVANRFGLPALMNKMGFESLVNNTFKAAPAVAPDGAPDEPPGPAA